MPDTAQLVDIMLPEPVSLYPATGAWAVVVALVLVVLVAALWAGYRHWRRQAYRRAACARLEIIENQALQPATREAALRALPAELRRTALAAYPRGGIAARSGEDWLTFLDTSAGMSDFRTGAGRLVAELPYLPDEQLAALDPATIRDLAVAAERWVRQHRV